MNDHDLDTECPYCGMAHSRVANIGSVGNPSCGDFSVCVNCGCIGQFNESLKLHKISDEVLKELSKKHPEAIKFQRHVRMQR